MPIPVGTASSLPGIVVAFVTVRATSSLSGRCRGSKIVPIPICPDIGGRSLGGESTMEATRTKSGAGFGQSWRELSHTPTYQVPVVLGSIVALLVGILTYVFDASAASKIVAATPNVDYLVQSGIVGMMCYAGSKQNAPHGSIMG